MQVNSQLCIRCGKCLSYCKIKYPITFTTTNAVIDTYDCINCGACLETNCDALASNFTEIDLQSYSPDEYAFIFHPSFRYHTAYKGYVSELINMNYKVYDGSIGGDISLYLLRTLCQQSVAAKYIHGFCKSSISFLQKYIVNRDYEYSPLEDIISLAIKYYQTQFKEHRKFLAIVPCSSYYYSTASEIILFKNISERQQYIPNLNIIGDYCLGEYIAITGDYSLGFSLLDTKISSITTYNVFKDFNTYNQLSHTPDVWIPKQHCFCVGDSNIFRVQKMINSLKCSIDSKTVKTFYNRFKSIYLTDYSTSRKFSPVTKFHLKNSLNDYSDFLNCVTASKTGKYMNCGKCGYNNCKQFVQLNLMSDLSDLNNCPILKEQISQNKISSLQDLVKYLSSNLLHKDVILQDIKETVLNIVYRKDLYCENEDLSNILAKLLEISMDFKDIDIE